MKKRPKLTLKPSDHFSTEESSTAKNESDSDFEENNRKNKRFTKKSTTPPAAKRKPKINQISKKRKQSTDNSSSDSHKHSPTGPTANKQQRKMSTEKPITKPKSKIVTESEEERALGGVHGAMLKVTNILNHHEEAWVFYGQITEEIAPGYSKIIRRPMCLKKIEENIKIKKYKTPQAFVDDVILMFNNCRLYNGPESEYTETGDSLHVLIMTHYDSLIKLMNLKLFSPKRWRQFFRRTRPRRRSCLHAHQPIPTTPVTTTVRTKKLRNMFLS